MRKSNVYDDMEEGHIFLYYNIFFIDYDMHFLKELKGGELWGICMDAAAACDCVPCSKK